MDIREKLRLLLAETPLSGKSVLTLSLLVLLLLFFPFPSKPYTYVLGPLFDGLHFTFFLAVSIPAFLLLRKIYNSDSNSAIISTLSLFLVSTAIELIQPLTGRSANLVDILNGLLGICCGTLLMLWIRESRLLALTTIILTLVIQIHLLHPAYLGVKAALWQMNSHPVLATFENPLEALLWKSVNSSLSLVPVSKRHSGMRVITKQNVYSGVSYNAGHKDWSEYSVLRISVENPGPSPLRLSLRIDDNLDSRSYHSRFNMSYNLTPGESLIDIPLDEIQNGPKGRKLNLEGISKVYLFLAPEKERKVFKILGLELLK